MTLRTLNYGNYGTFLIMGNAGFCPSAVVSHCGRSFRWKVWMRVHVSSLVRIKSGFGALGCIPRGSINTTIMELGPQSHNGDGLLGPNSIIECIWTLWGYM